MLNNTVIALEIMVKGMGGIFIATLLIIGVVYLLSKITSKDSSKSKDQKES